MDPTLFLSPALLDLFLSSDASICSTMVFLHWEIVLMLLSQFPLTFHEIHNGMPHFISRLWLLRYPLPQWRWGVIFQGQWGVCFFICQMGRGLLYMGGIPIRGFPGETPVPISCPISKARPKSAKVNLTNCHREICRIKFYQIVTSDVLTSLWQFDKMLF